MFFKLLLMVCVLAIFETVLTIWGDVFAGFDDCLAVFFNVCLAMFDDVFKLCLMTVSCFF